MPCPIVVLFDVSQPGVSCARCFCFRVSSRHKFGTGREEDWRQEDRSFLQTSRATYGGLTCQILGYLFCSEMMPINHELRLMLVNTLRKVSSCKHCGIESLIQYRILKVLKYHVSAWLWTTSSWRLTRMSSPLFNHAYTSYFHMNSQWQLVLLLISFWSRALFSLCSSHVRRRALLAIRALSNHNPELLTRLHGTVIRILRDPDETVVKAALTVATFMSKVRWSLIRFDDI